MPGLGQIVQDLRAEYGWSVVQLAAEAGVGQATIWRLEQHDNIAQIGTLRKIAKALGTTAGALLSSAEEEVVAAERDTDDDD